MADTTAPTPLIDMRNISIAFGGIRAVDDASIDLFPGEVVALLGRNGADKSTLIKILSGAYKRDSGQIFVNGGFDLQSARRQEIWHRDDLPDAGARRQCRRRRQPLPRPRADDRLGTLDDGAMEAEARKVTALNPRFQRFKEPVVKLSGGQRQSVAIARAILFNARILIMDEPTAALGPQETAQVGELVMQLKADGIGIFLISHDIHDVFELADRVCVMKNGRVVGTARTSDVTQDEVLGLIILGKCPPGAIPGPGALKIAA